MKIDLTHDEMQVIKAALNYTQFESDEHNTIKDKIWVKLANAIQEDIKRTKHKY